MRIAQRALLMSGGEIPAAYERLEYIQSDGAQYINTRYLANNNSEFELDGTILKWWKNSTVLPFASADSSAEPPLYIQMSIIAPNSPSDSTGYYGTANPLQWKMTLNTRFTQVLNTSGMSINGVKVRTYSGIQPFQMSTPLGLFGNLYISTNTGLLTSSALCSIRVYSFKIRENGKLKRNFIPAKRKSDNEIGMYDTVTARFYENLGTGLFTGA